MAQWLFLCFLQLSENGKTKELEQLKEKVNQLEREIAVMKLSLGADPCSSGFKVS